MSTNYALVVHQLGHTHRELTAGAWARGGSVYGPYGYGAVAGTAYNPARARGPTVRPCMDPTAARMRGRQ